MRHPYALVYVDEFQNAMYVRITLPTTCWRSLPCFYSSWRIDVEIHRYTYNIPRQEGRSKTFLHRELSALTTIAVDSGSHKDSPLWEEGLPAALLGGRLLFVHISE